MTWSTTSPPFPVTPWAARDRWMASPTVRKPLELRDQTRSTSPRAIKKQLPHRRCSRDGPNAGNSTATSWRENPKRSHRDRAVEPQLRADVADRCVEAYRPWRDAAEVLERADHADRAVAAHPEGPDVVEEHDAGDRAAGHRRRQQSADHGLVAARLEDRPAPERPEPAVELGAALSIERERS